jgi:hypothetical protein
MNGVIPPHPNTSSWSGPQFKKKHRGNFSVIVLISLLSHACYMPVHLILLDLITLIIFFAVYKL